MVYFKATIMVKNIVFTKANNNLLFTAEMKNSATNGINSWLAPLEKELNDSNAQCEMFLDENNVQHFAVTNISKELEKKVMERLDLFSVKHP